MRASAETDDTSEVEEACALMSAVTGVTVNTVDCVVDCTTGTADGSERDVDAVESVATEAVTATLGGAIVLEIVVGAGLVTAFDVGVIVTLNAGCANRFETGSAVVRRSESDDACSIVGETNKRGSPPENGAPNTTDAEPGVEECGQKIEISG